MNNKAIITALFLATIWFGQAQKLSRKVGTNPTLIQPSAALEVESTTKGFLPPRMTKVQMNAIATSTEGLIVYCTDCTPKGLYNFDGTNWTAIGSAAATSSSVFSDCNVNGFVGAYVNGFATSGTTFSVTITNNTFSTATLAFQNSDLVLSGITGLSVGTPTPTSATLNPGQSQLVSYPITGTPGATGTLTGTWIKLSLNCVKTKNIGLGDATFTLPQSKYVVSVYNGMPLVDIQGYITNTAPNKFVINVPYTGGLGSYTAYTSSVVTSTAGEGGDVNGFTISYPAGTFSASGTIPVTVMVDGDASYSAKKQLFGAQETIATLPFLSNGNLKGNIVLDVISVIPDKMFGLPDNNGNNTTHNFIYLPVTGADGKTWLNNNLGAHYANMNHSSYDPVQQATSAMDHLAYGSLFQWGRAADGHELMTWTTPSAGTPLNSTTTTLSNSDTLADALFIRINTGNYDWRNPQNANLWHGVNGTNNPCPIGFRVPTIDELSTLVTASSITNSNTAASSTLKFTVPGNRSNSVVMQNSVGSIGYYWSRSVNSIYSSVRIFNSASTSTNINSLRAYGFTVRCIKD